MLWDCRRQDSVMAPKIPGPRDTHTSSYSENNNPGTGVNGFCRYDSSPKSVDLKLQRIFRWAWSKYVSPLRPECFFLLVAGEEIKDSKHEKDSTHHHGLEGNMQRGLDWQPVGNVGLSPKSTRNWVLPTWKWFLPESPDKAQSRWHLGFSLWYSSTHCTGPTEPWAVGPWNARPPWNCELIMNGVLSC